MGEKITITLELDIEQLKEWAEDGVREYVKDIVTCFLDEADHIRDTIEEEVKTKAKECTNEIVDEAWRNCRAELIEKAEERIVEGW